VERPADARRSGPPDLASPGFTPLPAHVPWDVEGFEVSDDGRTVAFVTNEGGISRLHLLDATTGREKTAPKLPDGLITSLVWHANSRDLGLTLSSARSPADAYSVDVVTGQLTR
jgi:tricorn protease-like protein